MYTFDGRLSRYYTWITTARRKTGQQQPEIVEMTQILKEKYRKFIMASKRGISVSIPVSTTLPYSRISEKTQKIPIIGWYSTCINGSKW